MDEYPYLDDFAESSDELDLRSDDISFHDGASSSFEDRWSQEDSFDDMGFLELTPHEVGRVGEKIAAYYLEQRDCTILECNYRCPEGEADIVALGGGDEVVLVEVKTRRVKAFGDLRPEDAVDECKISRYRRICSCYLMDNFPVTKIRFDVVAVQLLGDSEARIDHFYDVFSWGAQ